MRPPLASFSIAWRRTSQYLGCKHSDELELVAGGGGSRRTNEMLDVEIKAGVFVRHDPKTTPAPVLIDVSRSGREYPHDFRSPLPFTDLHDNVSMYVEDLYAIGPSLGATMLYACFPNTYIDTNRSAADIDETLIEGKWPGPIKQSDFTSRGLGLLKRLSRYGQPLQERKLTVEEVQQRLAIYHEPYHVELGRDPAGYAPTASRGVPVELPLHVGGRRTDARRSRASSAQTSTSATCMEQRARQNSCPS